MQAEIAVTTYDQNTYKLQQKPMLLVDKVCVVVISTVAAPYLLPKYLYDDLVSCEMHLRKACPKDYGIRDKKTVLDYMF